jgi:PKD repeat protein
MGCQALFFYYPYDSLNLNHTFQFLDTSWGNPESWLWDFGDGTTSDLQNPLHTFPDYGLFNVCLSITSTQDSCFDTHCETVFADTIPGNCESYFTYQVQDLVVGFEGHSLNFFSLSWEWQFGDGTGGEGQYITHVYLTAGSYTVTLVTTDESGCTWSSSQTITIGPSPLYTLFGQVSMGNTYADEGSATLFRMDDPTGVINVVDVQDIDSAGMFHFPDVLPGNYLILAELSQGSTGYGEYLPTYFGDVVFWGDASIITLGEPQNPYNIHLVTVGSYPSGPGLIDGTITQELAFSPLGAPAGNIEIMLMDQTGQVIAFRYSSEDGTFDFTNLALGLYSVYAEVPGKTTIPAVVTLDVANTTITIEIVITGDQVNQINGINDPIGEFSMHVGKVYPDPVTENAFIPIRCSRSVSAEITIINQIGQKIHNVTVILHEGSNTIPLKTNDLPEGIYLLKIADERGNTITEKFIK